MTESRTFTSPTTRNICLIGFMGTGKTTLGQLLANQLGWAWVDTDNLIEKEAGMAIPEIFATKGESVFRQMETEALEKLAGVKQHIITTGGGIVLKPRNVELLRQLGWVVGLQASVEAIVKRVGEASSRPLLEDNPEMRIRALLEQRKYAYDFADQTIDTTELSVSQVLERIISAIRLESF